MTEIEAWSTNNEDFNYSSLEDFIDSNSDELEAGQTVYVGDGCKPELKEFCDSNRIIEIIQNNGYDIGGEYADDFIDDITAEAKQELDDLLMAWMEKYVKINFYTVHNVREYILTEEDLTENTEKKLKKFDLEAAKNGAAVVDGYGREARIICFDAGRTKYPIVAIIKGNDCDDIKTFSNDGVYNFNTDCNKYDLFMATTKKTGWINIYRRKSTDSTITSTDIFKSKEDADYHAINVDNLSRIDCIEIEWEE